ncbi:hypothetical protein MUP59_04175 [Candidatus Bathyarchaeota archaeon]|jgi:F0F1-type ATP synthase assembly protein I|nr:hypothetical protein [Candidatus Bathyarchaeota archaeon]
MSKELKEGRMTLQELHKRLVKMGKTANEYKTQFKEVAGKRPLETAAVIFVTGLMSGILVGAVRSKRH